MGFFKRLVWIFVSPNQVFDDIRERRVTWLQPWIFSSLISMVIAWLAMPIQHALLEVNSKLTSEQIDQQLDMMDRFGFMWVVLAPAFVLILTLIVAGVSYIAVTLSTRAATFKQYFTLSLFTGIVGMMGQLASTMIVRARGVDNIMAPEDAQMSLSLRALAPDNPVVRGLFGSVEFFAIWSLVLLTMGLMRVFDMKRGQAIGVAVLLWVIFAAMAVLGEAFGGMNG